MALDVRLRRGGGGYEGGRMMLREWKEGGKEDGGEGVNTGGPRGRSGEGKGKSPLSRHGRREHVPRSLPSPLGVAQKQNPRPPSSPSAPLLDVSSDPPSRPPSPPSSPSDPRQQERPPPAPRPRDRCGGTRSRRRAGREVRHRPPRPQRRRRRRWWPPGEPSPPRLPWPQPLSLPPRASTAPRWLRLARRPCGGMQPLRPAWQPCREASGHRELVRE